jgi:diaphanous 1
VANPEQLGEIKSNDRTAPTLLHFVVQHLKDKNLLGFQKELPHVEAASRVSFANLKETSGQLQSGLKQVRDELEITPQQDRFRSTMESFVYKATPAIDALKDIVASLDADLRSLLLYYGEDPTSKTEDFFALVVSFSASVARVEDEMAEAERRKARLAAPGRRSIGRGDFDQALKGVRSGQAFAGSMRRRVVVQPQRPLSRLFLE